MTLKTLDRSPRRLHQRSVKRCTKLVYQFIDLRIRDYEWWRRQDLIASLSVQRAPHWIAYQSSVKRSCLYLGVYFVSRVKRGLGPAINHNFDSSEHAAPAYVPYMGVLRKTLLQCDAQILSRASNTRRDAVIHQTFHHSQRCGASRWVAQIGATMLKKKPVPWASLGQWHRKS